VRVRNLAAGEAIIRRADELCERVGTDAQLLAQPAVREDTLLRLSRCYRAGRSGRAAERGTAASVGHAIEIARADGARRINGAD